MDATTAPVYTRDWFSNNIPVWTRLLAPLAGRPGVAALEIGSMEGRSARWLLEHVLTGPGSRIDCVDTFLGEHETGEKDPLLADVLQRFRSNTAPWAARVGVHVGMSATVVRGLAGPYDLVYVDGSHTAADVIADAVLAWPLLASGGVMIFDDYEWDMYRRPELNPRIAVDAFLDCHAGWFDLLHRSYQVAIRKRGTYSIPAAEKTIPARPTSRGEP